MKTACLAFLALAGCAAGREWVEVPGTGLRIELVPVPGERSVLIAARETTWEEFDAFYEHPEEEDVDGVTRPSSGKSYLGLSGLPSEFMEPKRPVTAIRWHSALMYCEWLSRKTGRVFRLPTEREWRAADVGGDDGWHAGNSGERTHAAGERGPNALGVRDLRGNAWEYLLEPFQPPSFGPAQIGGGWNSSAGERRRAIPEEWIEADPSRPASVWWFRTDFAQGFRVVRAAGTLGPVDGLEVRVLGSEERAVGRLLARRVSGEIINRRDRALEELGLKVFYLKPDGRPHLTDKSGEQNRRATFNVVYPVLRGQTPGVAPGGRAAFVVDVPLSFDPEDQVQPERFGAAVLSARFAP